MKNKNEKTPLFYKKSLETSSSSSSTTSTFLSLISKNSLSPYFIGNLLFSSGSAAYCALDLVPSLSNLTNDILMFILAFIFVIDAIVYLQSWKKEDEPSRLDLSGEYVNIAASFIYFISTIIVLTTNPEDVLILWCIYAAQAISSILFFIDALLYFASWRIGLLSSSYESLEGDKTIEDLKGKEWQLFAHILNIIPAFVYTICSIISMYLFSIAVADGRGKTTYDENRTIRGRLVAGAEPIEIEIACIVGDFLYLLCSFFTFKVWFDDLNTSE
jgi:hypothetical protein